jgi:hypothetical protein
MLLSALYAVSCRVTCPAFVWKTARSRQIPLERQGSNAEHHLYQTVRYRRADAAAPTFCTLYSNA